MKTPRSSRPCALLWLIGTLALSAAQEETSSLSHEAELTPDPSTGKPTLTRDPLILPAWSSDDLRELQAGRPANLGGGLWPAQLFPLLPVPPRRTAPARELLALEKVEAAQPPAPPGELGDDLLALYFGEAPPAWISDPQKLLPPDKVRELGRFLAQQARDAKYDVRLLVFAAKQEVPVRISAEELSERWFGSAADDVLALYFFAEPARAKLVFSGQVRAAYRPEDLAAVLAATCEKAARSPYPTTQLDDFLLHLSIALYALEKTPPSRLDETAPSAGRMDLAAARSSPLRAWPWLAALIVIASGLVVWRHRRRRTRFYVFPDREIVPRLGAPHSGGAGVVARWN